MSYILLLWAHGDPSAALDLDPARTLGGTAVRFVQAVIEGAPYLLCGVALSGLLREVVGADAVRRRLGTPSPGRLMQASLVGLALPLGALGALPVARRLDSMGVPRGTVLAFLLSAAVLDPLALVLGMSLMGPRPVAGCLMALLAWSLVAGLLVNRWTPCDHDPGGGFLEKPPGTAAARLLRIVASMADECSGPSLRDLVLAASGAGLLGAFLPPGWLQDAASPPRAAAGLVAAAVGSVASETPLEAMHQAGVLLRDGYTHQVAFTLLGFGSGFNLAVLIWLGRRLGPGMLAGVLAIGLGLWSLLGWGFDRPGRAVPSDHAFHTHAFDELGRPNVASRGVLQVGQEAWSIVAKAGASRLPAFAPIAALAAVGLVARWPRVRAALMRLGEVLGAPRPGARTRAWERPLSSRWTAALGLAAAIPAVVALILTYYPAPAVLFDEMVTVHTEVQYAVRQGQTDEALKWIDRWEDLARKLGPGVVLRTGWLDAGARGRLDELLESIGSLRAFLEEGRVEEARTLLGHVSKAQQECRLAFAPHG